MVSLNELKLKNIIPFCILLLVFFILSCKREEIDFSKYNNKTSPLIVSPIGKAQLSVSDLIRKDSLILYDSTGLIRFFMSSDSVFGDRPAKIFEDFKVKELQSVLKFDQFILPSINLSKNITIRDMIEDLDETEKQKLEPLDGRFEVFPSLVLYSSTRNKIFENVDFKYLDFSKGKLKMTFTNRLPTRLENVLINVYDTSLLGVENLIGSFEFPSVLPLSSEVSEIDLQDKRLTDKLAYVLTNAESVQSATPVLINLNDYINVDVKLTESKVFAGLAKLPQISLPNQLTRIDLSSNFPDLEIKEIGLLNALFTVKLESTIKSTISLKLALPDISRSGVQIEDILLDNQTNNEKSLDVSGAKIYLGSNLSKPYNNLRIVSTTTIDSTSSMVYFDSSDKISLTYGFPDFNVDYVSGYFGTNSTTVNLGDIDLSSLRDYTENLTLSNPTINLKIQNSIGIPSKLKFDIYSFSQNGNSLKLNLEDQEIGFPTFIERGKIFETNIIIDTSNSNISECLSLPANKLSGSVEVITNYAGKVYTNFLDSQSEIKIGYSVDVPMVFTMEETKIFDTFPVGNLVVDLRKSEYIELLAKTINELPFDAVLGIKLADTGFVVLDSLENIDLIRSASVDENGRVISSSETETTIRFTDELAEKFRQNTIQNIIIQVKLNSGDIDQKKIVALNSQNKIVTTLAFKYKM